MKLNDFKRAQQLSIENPAWWCENVLGTSPWEKQRLILESVRDNKKTAVASCHGAGKSFTAANVALWFLYNHRPAIVITTAPTDRQVRGILWKEIRTMHSKAKVPLGGSLLTQELKLDTDWWMWGFTAPDYDPDRFQGYHEENVLVIVDEAVGVSDQIFQGVDGILTGKNSRLLCISNPTEATGTFGQMYKSAGVKKFFISAFDTPNFTQLGITMEDIKSGAWKDKVGDKDLPYPKLIDPEWVWDKYDRWGEESPSFESRVLGQFPTHNTDALIPMAWINAAVTRKLEPGKPIQLAVDVARFGPDETVMMLRRGQVARIVKTLPMSDTMTTTGHTIDQMRKHGAEISKIDGDGIGGGVVDRLREQGHPCSEMRSGQSPMDTEQYINTRAEWWWTLRKRFEAGEIDIEDDPELITQLASIKYFFDSAGRIKIESKEDMKKRGISSPDRADALMLAFAYDHKGAGTTIRAKSVGKTIRRTRRARR